MKKAILEVYALAVCFFAVACFAIALGTAAYDAVQIADPELTLSGYQYEQYQSNEAFKQRASSCCSKEEKDTPLTDDQITKKREDGYALQLRAEKHSGFQSLIRMLITLLIDAVVLIFHWLIARRARQSSST